MPLRPASEKKILDAADDLFFTNGIAATPVDAVLARAGVSAATMYRGYRSKEALVAAALTRRHHDWLATWDAAVARCDEAGPRLLAIFDALDDFRSRPTGARWCAFLASAAEYVDPPADVAEAVRLDTETLRTRLTDLARPLVGPEAEGLAERLLLVVTGDLAMRLREPDRDTTTGRAVAASLIAAAGATGPTSPGR
ncbi:MULTISPECIES: TetR/AcrR family transcriptional regulator [unclassified Frigoribacterium]|uniref:TetR/AcrR family transcriptional regulator n=1 Tax=unclassified Frigoribacterium TaxID=2627005 RepID=UPI0012F15F93|nr:MULTISPECIES: TetR/AcrR family transcriptional regulator [unclassified Frigoribacterium]NQW87115.1 TetR/AcrR family transcriptional regulator [Frigoribacterium sp. VKM Ac-2860]NQX08446.1 TetR/AcrR family transcriptional regulator [Frigoribacterium sp. VKM Ac-2859]VXB04889.1 TetR family transcriptional regulator [Frigoribacterium sp. 9N]